MKTEQKIKIPIAFFYIWFVAELLLAVPFYILFDSEVFGKIKINLIFPLLINGAMAPVTIFLSISRIKSYLKNKKISHEDALIFLITFFTILPLLLIILFMFEATGM